MITPILLSLSKVIWVEVLVRHGRLLIPHYLLLLYLDTILLRIALILIILTIIRISPSMAYSLRFVIMIGNSLRIRLCP